MTREKMAAGYVALRAEREALMRRVREIDAMLDEIEAKLPTARAAPKRNRTLSQEGCG